MSATDEPEGSNRGTAEFDFNLADPLFEQMLILLKSVEPLPLTFAHTNALPERPGVYLLRHEGTAVYIGKADKSLRERLGRHARNLCGRQKLRIEDMTFSCITFATTWDPFLPEKHLTEHYKTSESHGWNGKGFGSNEQGVNRGNTRLKADNFHKRYPLKDDWICANVSVGEPISTLKLLQAIKQEVPFFFRFQGNRLGSDAQERARAEEARRDYESTNIVVPRAGMTARELLVLVASRLPGRWQATITPSHMLLYKEQGATYPEMEVAWPTDGG